jgi:molybdopterin converting factor small subunit
VYKKQLPTLDIITESLLLSLLDVKLEDGAIVAIIPAIAGGI